jgi:adenosylcobalamin-dependent ribonucleoside-triphosphate reductase
LTSTDIVDLMNLIGKCVVSGNVRRSAEIAIGQSDDKAYLDLKNWEVNPDRMDTKTGWGWTSNNSIFATVGMDYEPVVSRVVKNGEPGLVWMDVTRRYGRLADAPDGKDHRAQGYNPCGEQPLESREMCTLVNLYPTNCNSLDEFKRAIKFAYLYAKTVTLIATHWPRTNAIMQRNRRIGASFNGAWQFVEQKGYVELDRWMDEGFQEIIARDQQYSEWLCVRESIRHTTVKPDGTGGLLAGATPGAHANPGGEFYLRRIRYAKDDPIVPLARQAGYTVEPAYGNMDTTVVIAFPVAGPTGVRSQGEASVYEKVALAARLQRLWSDNSVSFTLTYDPETEARSLKHILAMFEGQLKTISFLPQGKDIYPQMPYEEITREEYEEYTYKLFRLDWDALYEGRNVEDIELERGCTTDVCEVKST